MTSAIRRIAWVLVVGLAAFQAYAQRYAVGPDGIAYLDLSDAVADGRWSGLINLYWSPLYPLLIGIGRLVTRVGPANEVAVVHALGAALFVSMFAAYEYFLVRVLELATATRHSALGGKRGEAAAYGFFICVAFTLTPLQLTTPDLLAATATLLAFGALLRLQRPEAGAGPAIVLGASLGAGALAKSFMIPWAGVCLAVAAAAIGRARPKQLLTSIVVWLVFVGPWTLALSRTAGRITFGDTGRLTYAWFVNNQDAPSLGGVPMGARTAPTEAILPRTGITGDAPGTDPMWFDPERWAGPISPHFDARDQLESLATSGRFYVENLAPFLFLILVIAVAPAAARRDAWRRGWIVLVPAAAGMFGYALVLVTARYFMPFVVAGVLTLLATLPVPRRIHPLALVIGLAVPVALESIDDRSAAALALVVSIIGGMVAGAAIPMRRVIPWGIAVLVAAGVTHVVLPAAFPGVLLLGGAGLVVVLWAMSRRAIRAHRPIRFAHGIASALTLSVAALLVLRFAGRLGEDRAAFDRAGSEEWGNLSAKIAADLATHGVQPGARIAVIGPHADSYWARTGRLKIVASVPRPIVPMFWRLSPVAQDSLLAEFALAGATVAIASVGPDAGEAPPDSSWTPVRYRGWIKPLVPRRPLAPPPKAPR